MGLSNQKTGEEHVYKKIDEMKELKRVCGYCEHYGKLKPGMDLMQYLIDFALQNTYHTGYIVKNKTITPSF